MFIICFPYLKACVGLIYTLSIQPVWNGSLEILGVGSSLKTLGENMFSYIPSIKGDFTGVETEKDYRK